MATSISLGNFFTTSDGKNVLGGAGGSGLDTQSIVKELVGVQQTANVTPLSDKVTLNNNKISALTQFKTLMTTLQTAATQLRNVPGFNTASQNAFQYVKATVSSNSGVAGSSYVSVTAQPGSAVQSYTINKIEQLAQATKQTTGVFNVADSSTSVVFAGSNPNSFSAGTFTLNGASITLNAGDSLDQVAANFNAVSTQTGLTANVLQVAAGQYKMVFTATQTGTANQFDISTANAYGDLSDPDGVLTNAGIVNGQPALDAKFTLDGVPLVRSTNTISDAVSGITFALQQVTPTSPATTLNVNIAPDTTTAENAIVNFMNAYNAVKQFAANQTQRNADGTLATTDYLADSNAMNTLVRTVETTLSSIVPGLGSSNYNSLASIGITFTSTDAVTGSDGKVSQAATSNVLTYDQTALETALASNFQQVASLFQFSLTSNNSNLALYSGPNSLPANAMTVSIDPNTSTYTASYTDSAGQAQTVNLKATLNSSGTGYSLSAPAGSALAGLTLLYNSTSAATINVSATQGIASLVYQTATNAVTNNTGTIDVEQNAIKSRNDSLNTQITTQTNLLDAYQTKLLNQFSALEAAITKANSILQTLYAQQVAALGSNG